MAKRKTKKKRATKSLIAIANTVLPHKILNELSKVYGSNQRKSKSDAEHEFWLKSSRATANLGSGMEKWLEEMIDEEEDENE